MLDPPTTNNALPDLSSLPIFNPPLLSTSRLIRRELLPLHQRALLQAQAIIKQERETLQRRLDEGKCFEWDHKERKNSQGHWSGAEVWRVFLAIGVRVQGLERLDERVRERVEGVGSGG